ncbi:MAG TPA: tetratricopeptide repeat protein [Acidobacteriota bacterium]|nr:tetratricopeptide repeat protein [Acidobacteriota bacterium]
MSTTQARQSWGWQPALLAALCAAVYWNSLHGAFQLDDYVLIKYNFTLRSLSDLSRVMISNVYRPLLVLTYALNFAIGRLNPFSYHVVNAILHAANIVFFYFLLARISGNRLFCFVAAAFMAVHPLNTEAVSYISSRSTLLCALFYLTSLLFFDSYLRNARAGSLWGFVVCFLLAITCKEEGLIIPLAALMYEFFFFGGESVKKHKKLYGLTFGSVALIGITRLYFFFKHPNPFNEPFLVWVPTEASVWVRYIWLAIFPVSLNVDHDVPALSFASWQFWASAFFIAIAIIILFRIKRQQPLIAFCGLWFFVNLLVSSSFIPLNEFMAEHLVYLSLFGYCAVLSGLLFIAADRWPALRKVFLGIGIILILGFGLGTVARNRVWRTDLALWSDSVAKSPHKIRPRLNLANAFILRQQYPLAIQQYEAALQLNPTIKEPYSGLGITYLRMGNLQLAEENFRKALSIDPEFTDAKTGMGMVLYYERNYPGALQYFEQVYAERQDAFELITMMADSYLHTGNYRRAIAMLEKGVTIRPDFLGWYPALVDAYYRAGEPEIASQAYDRYRSIFPQDPASRLHTAEILVEIGRTAEAKDILTQLLADPTVGAAAKDELSKLP